MGEASVTMSRGTRRHDSLGPFFIFCHITHECPHIASSASPLQIDAGALKPYEPATKRWVGLLLESFPTPGPVLWEPDVYKQEINMGYVNPLILQDLLKQLILPLKVELEVQFTA